MTEIEIGEALTRKTAFNADINLWWSGVPDRDRLIGEAVAFRVAHGQSANTARSAVVLGLHACAAWAHYGFNVFRLTHSLGAVLLFTDLDPEVPQLPFPSFKVELPDRLVAASNGRFFRRALVHNCSAQGAAVLHARITYNNDTVTSVALPWDCIPREDDDLDLALRDDRTTLLRLIRGLCSFLHTRVEPLELDNAKAVERAKWTKKPTPRVFTVGRTVKISPELRRVVTSSSDTPLWKLQNRHVVRGHWRWQPIGHRLPEGVEGPQNAKKTWIEPYWKGPEGAEAWRHVYEC